MKLLRVVSLPARAGLACVAIFLLAGCYASTTVLTTGSQYDLRLTNMLEGYAAPEMLMTFSKAPEETSLGVIETVLEQAVDLEPSGLRRTLAKEIQQGFRNLGKAFYLRLDMKEGPAQSYCLGIVVQERQKCICVMNFTEAGVMDQGLFHPFSNGQWATITVERQKRSTTLFDMQGRRVTPRFRM